MTRFDLVHVSETTVWNVNPRHRRLLIPGLLLALLLIVLIASLLK